MLTDDEKAVLRAAREAARWNERRRNGVPGAQPHQIEAILGWTDRQRTLAVGRELLRRGVLQQTRGRAAEPGPQAPPEQRRK